MIKFAFTVSCAVLTFVASTSFADAQAETLPANHAPVCEAKTEIIQPLPEDLDLGPFSIDPIKEAPACTDADGDTLTLTSVFMPGTLDPVYGIHISNPPQPGQNMTITFSVSDSHGATTTSTLTIIRK